MFSDQFPLIAKTLIAKCYKPI